MDEDAWEGPLQQFLHEELPSNTCIRLIQIHAQLFRGDISCTLRIFESDTPNCPDYVALSYVWGDSTPTHTIYVNGLVYKVHQSLWEFLSHRRTKEDTEHVWIWTDLLCIDQAHHSEKNEQISRMSDIYSQAAYVISWLGHSQTTEEAIKTLVKFSSNIYQGNAPKYAEDSSQSAQIQRACCGLALREPYWGRVWVMQEVTCARHCIVACGDISIDFGDLLHRVEIAMERSVRFDDVSFRALCIRPMKTLADLKTSIQQGETMKFLELIKVTEFCEATRDQDRIYGLLGLASRLNPGFDSHALEVSQHKSLNDVWWDMIFMTLDGEANISIKSDLEALQDLFVSLTPPRQHCILEMGSSIRKSCAEIASRVSEAAYSRSIQDFLGIQDKSELASLGLRKVLLPGDVRRRAHYTALRSRQELEDAWDRVITHICNHEHDVPGLQTRLGWSTYAGLRFTTWDCIENRHPQKVGGSLPLGWFCAAHWPDPLEKTTAKHPIVRTLFITSRPEPSPFSACYYSRAEHDGTRCDLSLVVLRIEPLGVTCIVRSIYRPMIYKTAMIDFYCDCCDPSAYALEESYNAGWSKRGSLFPTS